MIGRWSHHTMTSMHSHNPKGGVSQLKESFDCSWMTKPPAVKCKLSQAGGSKDGGQNLPRSGTLLETSLPIMAASGNGPQRYSTNTMDSSRPLSTRDIGKSHATATFDDTCS